jgi:aspartokinase-like uncharacterized kinase
MWVVKIGGSLSRDPLLKEWLTRLGELGGGRVVVVPGGGAFADEVRDQQAHWRFGDLPAHNMAVLAMAQYALMMQAIVPALALAANENDILRVLRQARVAVWIPFEALREESDQLTHWGVTADSLAAWLSNRLNAERLILVKSCAIDPHATLAQNIAAGIVDERFGDFTRAAAYPIDLLSKHELPRMRELLLDPAHAGGGIRVTGIALQTDGRKVARPRR